MDEVTKSINTAIYIFIRNDTKVIPYDAICKSVLQISIYMCLYGRGMKCNQKIKAIPQKGTLGVQITIYL